MNPFEIFIIAIGVSMDAFAVSVCKGLSMKKITMKKAGIVGLYFGLFQAGMPLIGYLLGVKFKDNIMVIDHWIAFVLLALIGLNMIKDSSSDIEIKEESNTSLSFQNMSILAIATSIDALAVGITFAFLSVPLIPAISFIGLLTFLLSVFGVKIGNEFGTRYKTHAELIGGIVLICIGIKILITHL